MSAELVELPAPPFTLRLRRVPARGRVKAACLLTHAMMANGAYLLRRLAPACADAGLEVFVLDFRGHGLSGPGASATVSWTLDDLILGDLPLAVRAIRAALPGLPVVYAGHSLGGLTGLAFQATAAPADRVDRLCTLCTSVWDLPRTTPLLRQLRRRLEIGLLHGLARPLGRTFLVRPTRFGTDEESLPYLRQLARCYHTGTLRSADGATDYGAALRTIASPLRLTYADADAWAEADDAARLKSWLPASAEAVIEGPRSGLPFAPDHFGLLVDRRATPALQRVAEWLAAVPGAS